MLRASLFFLGLVAGLAGESLLFLQAQCREVQDWLAEDFRVLAFVSPVGEGKLKVIEETIRALPGVRDLRYVPPEGFLKEALDRDPDLADSISVLGENPLEGAFEIRLEDSQIAGLDGWLRSARSIADVDLQYKPLQAAAVAHLQFYARFLALVGGLAWATLLGAFLVSLWSEAYPVFSRPERLPSWALPKGRAALSCGLGTLGGMLLAGACAAPLDALGLWHESVSWARHAALLSAGGILGWLFCFPSAALASSPRRAAGAAPAAAGAVAALCFLAGVPAVAAGLPSTQRQLERVQAQLEEKRRQAELYGRESEKAERELSVALREKRRYERVLAELRSSRKLASARRAQWAERLRAVQSAREYGRSVLGAEIRGLVRARQASFDLYAGGSAWEEVLRRRAVAARKLYLGGLKALEGEAAGAQRTASRQEIELGRKASEARRRLGAQESAYARSERERAGSRRRAEEALREVRSLEESALALTRLVEAAQRRRAGPQRASAGPLAPHSLPWPASGRLVERFGKSRTPSGVPVLHNGIKIATLAGAAVKPVRPGRVIFSGPFRSYGALLIVDHEDGWYSVYGQLEKVRVRRGERVTPGVLMAGAGPDADRGLLYFEMRRGIDAVDPIAWLKKESP